MSEVRIFSGKSTSFDSVGEKLDAVVCIPHRILNGAYNGTISIPFDSVNSDMFVFGAVVRCSSGKANGAIKFDLYRLGQPAVQIGVGGSYKTADLWHISNDLGNPKIINKYLTAKTGQQALTAILTASADEQRFSGTTDITAVSNLRLELMSPQAGLMNTAVPCFINTWGGELERDNFTVNAWQRLGSDKGYQIELGKNLKGVTETPTGTGYTNRIIPSCKWGAMDSSVLTALKADIDVEKAANITLANDEKDAAYLAADTERDATVDSAMAEKTQAVANALAIKNAEYDQADAVYNAAPATAQAAKDAAQAQAEAVYDGTPQKALLLKNDMQANAEAQYLIDHDAAARTAAYVYADEVYNFTIADMGNVRSIAYAAADAAYDYAMASRADVRTNTKTVADNRYDAVVAAGTEKLANITADANEKQTAAEAVADTLKAAKIAQAQLYADEMKAVADKRFSDLADERKKDVFLPEGYIDSPNANVWDNLKHTKYYPCTSIRIGEMNTDTGVVDYPDLESAYNAMRTTVANLYTLGADVPGVSVKIDFVNLGDTKEYKKVAMLQSLDVQLGDTIHCKYYDRDISLRVCEDYWNSLSDRYESITIGDVVQNIAQSMYAQDVSLEGLKSEMNATVRQGEAYYGCSLDHKDGLKITGSTLLDGAYSKTNADVMGYFDKNDNFIGGLTFINSVLACVAGVQTNDPTNPAFWTTIGEVVIEGFTYKGILGFFAAYSKTVPFVRLVCYGTTSPILYLETATGARLYMRQSRIEMSTGGAEADSANLLLDGMNHVVQISNAGGTKGTIQMSSGNLALIDSRGNWIASDATGPYVRVLGGANKYL